MLLEVTCYVLGSREGVLGLEQGFGSWCLCFCSRSWHCGDGWQWLWEQLGSAVTRCPCCHRNSQGCGLAAHTESSWQTKSKAGCWASHPRLVLAQCLWMCWGHQLHRDGCNSSSHWGTATCLVGDRLCCPAQVRAPFFLLSLKCLMTLH